MGGEELPGVPPIVNLDLDNGQTDIKGIQDGWQWVPGISGHFSSFCNREKKTVDHCLSVKCATVGRVVIPETAGRGQHSGRPSSATWIFGKTESRSNSRVIGIFDIERKSGFLSGT